MHGTIPRAPVKSKGKGAPEGWSSFSLLPGTDPCLNCSLQPRPGCHGGLRHPSKASLPPLSRLRQTFCFSKEKMDTVGVPVSQMLRSTNPGNVTKGFYSRSGKTKIECPRLTPHTSSFMTVFLSRETLGTRVPSGNRMHVYWFHTSLRSFLPGFFGPCVSWFIHFPRDPWATGITVSVWFDLLVYSFIKFQISKFNTWWAKGRRWLMIFLAKWGERARMVNIGTILPALICPISNQRLISAGLCKGHGPFLEPRPH